MIENPKYEINPDVAPVITLSFIDSNDRQLYFTKIQITNGAIKHIKKINDIIPTAGMRVIKPSIAPKNALKIEICLNNT